MTGDPFEVFLGLFFLFAAVTPLGLVILRLVERLLDRRYGLTYLERLLVAPYCGVALLLLIAMIPEPGYDLPVIMALLGGGALVQTVLWVRDRGRCVTSAVRWASRPAPLAVLLGTIGLILLEIASAGTKGFPNAYDGSFQSTYVALLLHNHSAPWTLAPYASFGVIYPMGATIWMTLPPLLLGWPIQAGPVALPTFFLGLSPAAAFCWGLRIGGVQTSRGTLWALLFAGFFGLIGSWPRLFIGGSYDFAFALPLFLVSMGWLHPLAEAFGKRWRDTVVFGGLLGVVTSLSLALGEALVLLLVVSLLLYHPVPSVISFSRRIRHFLVALGIGVLFVARSVVGVVVWWGYPAHVPSAGGTPPYAPIPGLPSPTLGTFIGNLDPFVPFKWKISPIPILSLEVQILLAIGLLLAGAFLLVPRWRARAGALKDLVVPAVCFTGTMFFWTSWLILVSGSAPLASVFDSLASLYESSYLLFLFYQVIAIVPLVALIELVRERNAEGIRKPNRQPHSRVLPRSRSRNPLRNPGAAPQTIGLVALLVLPFAVGAVATGTQVPSFLSSHLDQFSNVTAADVDALQWAGGHLPDCSTVLVAPGSAALFLPLYTANHLDFPMMPLSTNLSYSIIVANLTAGTYTSSTRQALLFLNVTEVFVTGQTSVSYAPFEWQPLVHSSDFVTLFHEADAYVFGFDPGINQTSCAPT